MSLHAEMSEEARMQLQAQKRNSTISSVLIAILSATLIGLVLWLKTLSSLIFVEPDVVAYSVSSLPETTTTVKKTQTSVKKKPSAPSRANRVITSTSVSNITIATPKINAPQPSANFGSGAGTGFGFGSGFGSGGGGFGGIPGGMNKRCTANDRLQRLKESGGNELCEEAVIKSLRWMQETQKKNGSWENKFPVAYTGLALLSYLGHCETPASQEFGETVTNAIVYLVDNNLKQKGRSASDPNEKHWPYEHAIALYSLCEAYTFSKQLNLLDLTPGLEEAVQGGIQHIIDNQTNAGGWDYNYELEGRDGDTSIVAWHLQALKAAKSTGLKWKRKDGTIRSALRFIASTQHRNGGFGYADENPVGFKRSPDAPHTLTGAGTLCFQQHKGNKDSHVVKGIKHIAENSVFSFSGKSANLYEHYYSSQAMINQGGKEWNDYNKLVRDELIKSQRPDGSWPRSAGTGSQGETMYSTALATLMLEVYYRFLPGTGEQ